MGAWPKQAFYEVTDAPSDEVVSLDLVKSHLRIDSTFEDVLLAQYISTAIHEVERFTNLTLRDTGFRGNYGRFMWERTEYDLFVKLERAPFSALEVTDPVLAWDGDSFEAVDAEEYRTENKHSYARVLFDNFADFNFLVNTGEGPEQPYPIQINFRAGYATGQIPPTLVTAVLHYTAWLYENRGDCPEEKMPASLQTLLARHRILDRFA